MDANLPHIFVNACESQAQNLATHLTLLYMDALQQSIYKILQSRYDFIFHGHLR